MEAMKANHRCGELVGIENGIENAKCEWQWGMAMEMLIKRKSQQFTAC